MDLLEEYKKQDPQAFQTKSELQEGSFDEYGFVGRMVARLSGGHIRDARQANTVLLVVAVATAISALITLFLPGGTQNALPKNFERINQSQYAAPK